MQVKMFSQDVYKRQEYKKEGPVLGVGAKLFSVAGPVLVCGISSSVVVGVIYWIVEKF